MYVSLELARSIALWATMVLAAGDADVVQAAARAPSCRSAAPAGTSARRRSSCTAASAMTAEYSVGHYTSRLTALDHLLGDGDWALARLAENVTSYETVDPLGAPVLRLTVSGPTGSPRAGWPSRA